MAMINQITIIYILVLYTNRPAIVLYVVGLKSLHQLQREIIEI